MKLIEFLNNFLFLFFTSGVSFIYYFKIVFNKVIFFSLTFITATTKIDDSTPMGKAYVCLSVLITVLLIFEDFKRQESPYFIMIDCITKPMNSMVGIKRTIPYRRFKHVKSAIGFILVEILKILSAIYCIIFLETQIKIGVIINYIIFAMLLFESGLGTYLHTISAICLILHRNFFKKWLKWMCKSYFSKIMHYEVKLVNNLLTIEVREKEDNDSDTSPPHFLEDLRNNSS